MPHLGVCPKAEERRLPAAKPYTQPRLHKLPADREDSPTRLTTNPINLLHLLNLVIDSVQG